MTDEDFDYEIDDQCPRCGGEGWLMASDGDPSDWGEDTYCGAEDASITCRQCKGTGYIDFCAPSSTTTSSKGKE